MNDQRQPDQPVDPNATTNPLPPVPRPETYGAMNVNGAGTAPRPDGTFPTLPYPSGSAQPATPPVPQYQPPAAFQAPGAYQAPTAHQAPVVAPAAPAPVVAPAPAPSAEVRPPQGTVVPMTPVPPGNPPYASAGQVVPYGQGRPVAPYGAPYGTGYSAPYGQPYAQPRPTNGLAVASLVCGIVGLLGSPFIAMIFIPILVPIAAIVMGHIARSQLKRTPEVGGKGMALTGLILGYIPIGVTLIGLVLLIIAFALFGMALPVFMS